MKWIFGAAASYRMYLLTLATLATMLGKAFHLGRPAACLFISAPGEDNVERKTAAEKHFIS